MDHTKSRLTVSLPRLSKKTEESIFSYRLLLLTEERPQRLAFSFMWDEKEPESSFVLDSRFLQSSGPGLLAILTYVRKVKCALEEQPHGFSISQLKFSQHTFAGFCGHSSTSMGHGFE